MEAGVNFRYSAYMAGSLIVTSTMMYAAIATPFPTGRLVTKRVPKFPQHCRQSFAIRPVPRPPPQLPFGFLIADSHGSLYRFDHRITQEHAHEPARCAGHGRQPQIASDAGNEFMPAHGRIVTDEICFAVAASLERQCIGLSQIINVHET